jgi:hypothetical protein
VTDFTYTESYPYDQATFANTTTSVEKASRLGLNGGPISHSFLSVR